MWKVLHSKEKNEKVDVSKSKSWIFFLKKSTFENNEKYGCRCVNMILYILNERSRFEVGAFNDVYEVNANTFFKISNNIKSYILLNILTLNSNLKWIAREPYISNVVVLWRWPVE